LTAPTPSQLDTWREAAEHQWVWKWMVHMLGSRQIRSAAGYITLLGPWAASARKDLVGAAGGPLRRGVRVTRPRETSEKESPGKHGSFAGRCGVSAQSAEARWGFLRCHAPEEARQNPAHANPNPPCCKYIEASLVSVCLLFASETIRHAIPAASGAQCCHSLL